MLPYIQILNWLLIEGPYGIGRSLGPYPDDPGLQAGMVISNEPGYYKPGEFGMYIFD